MILVLLIITVYILLINSSRTMCKTHYLLHPERPLRIVWTRGELSLSLTQCSVSWFYQRTGFLRDGLKEPQALAPEEVPGVGTGVQGRPVLYEEPGKLCRGVSQMALSVACQLQRAVQEWEEWCAWWKHFQTLVNYQCNSELGKRIGDYNPLQSWEMFLRFI